MARPLKNNLDYFSHDADARNGKTLTIIRSIYGIEGYGVWFMLLEIIASSKNCSLVLKNNVDWKYLSAQIGVDIDTLKNIIETLNELGAIDQELYEQGIIQVPGLLERHSQVFQRRDVDRKRKNSFPEVSTGKTEFSVRKTPVSDGKTPVSDGKMPQSKVKESKENIYSLTLVNSACEKTDSWAFEKFSQEYPKARGISQARLEWAEINPNPATVSEIMAGLDIWKKSPEWRGENKQFIPAMDVFLRDCFWEKPPELDRQAIFDAMTPEERAEQWNKEEAEWEKYVERVINDG